MKKVIYIILFAVILLLVSSVSVRATTTLKVTADTLNIRKSASTSATVLSQLSKGDICELIEEDGDWYKITYKSYTGYVSKKYVEVQQSSDDSKQEENNTNTTNENVTEYNEVTGKTSKKTDVKILPLIGSSVIESLNKDAEITVISELNGWAYVQSSTVEGWIRSDVITNRKTTTIKLSNTSDTKQEENMNKQFIITNFAAFALMLFLPTGCRQADGKQDAVQSYRVIKVAASPVEISESYSAAIRGRQDVDILPQISGRIIRLKVKEGERVKTGQVLAVIDQVPYRAALRTAQANVSAAQAKVETARIELRGKQALFDEKVISDYELSLARNQLAVACAELEQAKAQESDARNNLSYTEIKSPSNGVVGTLPYRIGALVGPNMAQPFTVVSDNAEMYAYFSISENMLRRYSARYGSIDSMIAGTPEVGLQLNDGSLYKAKGRIETVSGVVDPVTGTVQIKALFPNPDRELLSGSIGNVILQNPKTEAVTIPMTATVELQDKIIAYRLKNGQAEAAYLTVDRLNDGNRFIVKEGLSVGDTIVAEGVGLVREGMSITPKNETK